MSKQLAPVAIFVYNRPDNTRAVIKALQNNYLAEETDVFIFSDGPRSPKNEKKVAEVRHYLKTIKGLKSVNIIERKENYYIERNIIEGVTEIINRFGKVIVLEDDGVSAKNFLTFMNEALDFYEHQEKVMHIATFTFIKMPDGYNKTFFTSYSENTGGGWGTWKNRWGKFRWFQNEAEGLAVITKEQINKIEMDGAFSCLASLKSKPIPWDICWNIAIIINNGLAVNSPWPLIKNNGLFNGTHFSFMNKILGKNPFEVELSHEGETIMFENHIIESEEAARLLKEFYKNMTEKNTRIGRKILSFFIKILVILKITKLVKRIIS